MSSPRPRPPSAPPASPGWARPVAALLALTVLLPAGWGAPLAAQPAGEAAAAGPDTDPEVARLARALAADRRAHLERVGLWGGASLLAGGALLATADGSFWQGFGAQSAGWGAVNLGIAAWGLLSESSGAATELAGALEDEDGWSHLLLVNLGLNVGYALVGGALVVAAEHGVSSPEAVRGHGGAVIVQGLGLLILDGVAWRASRGRLRALRSRVGAGAVGGAVRRAPGPAPGAVSFTLLSVPLG